MADGRLLFDTKIDDKGFTEGLSGLANKGKGLFKNMVGAQVVGNAISGVVGNIANGFGEMVSEMNGSNKAWKTFEGNLSMLGKSENEINQAQKSMQDFATKTIYSASDMAMTYSQMSAIGVDNVDKLVKGMGGLAASAENPQQAMKTLSQQMTQAVSKPTLAWQDFKLMMEQSPAGMSEVAKKMGYSLDDFVMAIQDGEISSKDFAKAVAEVGNNKDFSKMATEFKSVDQALDGMKETLANKLLPYFQKANDLGIKAVEGLTGFIEKIDFDKIARSIGNAVGKVKEFFQGFKDSGAIKAVGDAFNSVKSTIKGVIDSLFGGSKGLKDFKINAQSVGQAVGKAFKFLADKVKNVADRLKKLDPKALKTIGATLAGVIGGFALFNKASKVGENIKGFFGLFKKNPLDKFGKSTKKQTGIIEQAFAGLGKGIGNVFTGLGDGIGKAAQGIGKGLGIVLESFGKMTKTMNPVNALAFAGAIAIITAAFALLATQSEGVAEILKAIGEAISTIAEGIGKGIGAIIESIGTAFGNAAPGIEACGNAIAIAAPAIGEGIAIVVDAIGRNAEPIANGFATIVDSVGENVSKIIDSSSNLAREVPGILTAAGSAIAEAARGIGEGLKSGLEGAGTFVHESGLGIKEAAVGLGQGVSSILDGAGSFIYQAATGIGEGLKSCLEGAGSFVKDAGDGIGRAAEGLGTGVGAALDGAGSGIGKAADGIGSGIESSLNGVGTVIKDAGVGAGAAASGFGTGVGSALDGAGSAVGKAAEGLGSGIEKALNGASNLVKEIGDAFKKAADAVGDNSEKFGNGVKTFADAMKVLDELDLWSIATNLNQIKNIVNTFNKTGKKMDSVGIDLTKFTESITDLKEKVDSVVTNFENAETKISTAMTNLDTDISTKMTTIKDTMTNGFSDIETESDTKWKAIKRNAMTSTAGILTDSTSKMAALNALFTLNLSTLEATTKAKLTSIKNDFANKLSAMASNAQNGLNGISRAFTAGMNSLVASTQYGMSTMVGRVQSGMYSAIAVMRGAASSTYSIGYQMGAGLYSGLSSMAGAIYSLASSIAYNAVAVMRSALQIHSPSRKTQYLGKMTGMGQVVGMEDMIPKVRAMADKLGNAAIPGMNPLDEFTKKMQDRVIAERVNSGYKIAANSGVYSPNPYDRYVTKSGQSAMVTGDITVTSILDGRAVGYGTSRFASEEQALNDLRRSY